VSSHREQRRHPSLDAASERSTSAQIDATTPLLDQGLLDSLQIVTLIGELESGLGCQIPLDEVIPDNFRDLTSICALVERSLAASNDG